MPSKSSRSLSSTLRDILENIDLATIFVAGMSLEGFRTDKRTRYAVVRCLEIISEASRRLPPEIKMRHPELPWSNMAGAGNVYRHQYDDVEDAIIWQTVHEKLRPLRAMAEQELERLAAE